MELTFTPGFLGETPCRDARTHSIAGNLSKMPSPASATAGRQRIQRPKHEQGQRQQQAGNAPAALKRPLLERPAHAELPWRPRPYMRKMEHGSLTGRNGLSTPVRYRDL